MFSLFTGKFIAIILSGITFVVIARLLGPGNYGLYTIALGFSMFLSGVGNFGIGTYLNKHLAEARYRNDNGQIRKILMHTYLLIIIISAAITAIGILASPYAAGHVLFSSGIGAAALIIASLSIFFSMVYGTSYSALVGIERSGDAALSSVIVNSAQFASSVGLVLLGYGVDGAVAGVFVGYLFGMLYAASQLFGNAVKGRALRIAKPDLSFMKSVLRFSLPLAVNNFLNIGMQNFSILVLSVYATTVMVGNYGASFTGFGALLVIYGTITTVLIPNISTALIGRNRKDADTMFHKMLLYSMIISLPLVIITGVFSRQIVDLLISSRYAMAPEYLTLMSGGIVVNLVAIYITSFFVAKNKVYTVLKYSLISTAAEVVVLFALTPGLKAVGAIIATFYVGNLLDDYMFIRGARRMFGIKVRLGKVASLLASGAAVTLLLWLTMLSGSDAVEVILGAAILALGYPLALLATGIIDRELVADMKRITKNITALNWISRFLVRYLSVFSEDIGGGA